MNSSFLSKISVVLPFFNSERTLEQSLASLVKQTFRDFEVILVNDGSTDSSAAIAEEFAKWDSRFKLISTENRGVAAARNLGLSAATGEYIIHHDADDTRPESSLEDLWQVALRTGADIVVGEYQVIPESREPRLVSNIPVNNALDFAQLLLDERVHAGLWNKLVRRNLYESLVIPSELIQMEDKYLLVKILQRLPTIAYLPKCVYEYYVLEQSLSNAPSLILLESNKLMIDCLEAELDLERFPVMFDVAKAKYKWRRMLFDWHADIKSEYPEINNRILRMRNLPFKIRIGLCLKHFCSSAKAAKQITAK